LRSTGGCHPDGCEAPEDVILMVAKQPEDLLLRSSYTIGRK
jgi:hypothetical protein